MIAPVEATGYNAASMAQIPLSWQLDALTWQLGGIAILLAIAAVLVPESQSRYERPVIGLLALALLSVVSATTVAAIMMGWTAVTVLWLWLLRQKQGAYWLWLPLLSLWGAVALAQWPTWASGALLLTAVLQMGVWPLAGWRQLGEELPLPLTVLLYTSLPLSGLALLARFPEATQVGEAYGLFVALIGLLGILLGLRQTWSQLSNPTHAVAGLAQVQVNVALLTSVWGGTSVAIAEARLLLAVAILFLAAGRVQAKWQLVGPLIALAALAGLPGTIGFTARAALYTMWWENGRILLVLVLALMRIPLVTATFWLIWRQTADKPPSSLLTAAWTLPLVGLLTVPGWRDVPFLIWWVILLPFVLGLIATRLSTELGEMRTILRQAFLFTRPPWLADYSVTAAATSLGLALREAARILEGENGLLWLLTFVVILLLVRAN